jgi:hypothetical protein
VADAQEFADTLRQKQTKLGNFARIEVVSLLNKDATRANILAALGRLAGKEGETAANVPATLNQLKPAEPEDAVIVTWSRTAQKRIL